DCAESFAQCRPDAITAQLKILLQMSLVLVHGSGRRVVRVARRAGKYAKPRAAETESRDGISLPADRGDNVNRSGFTAEARRPDPELLLRGYERAALTLNFVRALVDGGFADIHHPQQWDLSFAHASPSRAEYERIVHEIRASLDFARTLTGADHPALSRVDFFTSHEALVLPYEQALTRRVPRRDGWFNLSTHLPWIGMRTASADGAHVEYARGLSNPVAMKVGPATDPSDLVRALESIDPHREPGRITLIHRFGAGAIEAGLPPVLRAVHAAGWRGLWICDPMHGNTENSQSGFKTRRFENILHELESAAEIHRAMNSHLGGVHVELTGENVTECTGGARGLSDVDLQRAYKSTVDPRLNYEQSLELALRLAGRSSHERRPLRQRAS
ncbi:MAG: 3-deoxy-7-phosphoheptulonate synthase, partial [Pseudomonadales bacterium]